MYVDRDGKRTASSILVPGQALRTSRSQKHGLMLELCMVCDLSGFYCFKAGNDTKQQILMDFLCNQFFRGGIKVSRHTCELSESIERESLAHGVL